MTTEHNATVATAPDVKIGCATFSGSRARAAAYNRKAPPYNPRPSQNGQLASAAMALLGEGNLRGGVIAIFINTLAAALQAIPTSKMIHFMMAH